MKPELERKFSKFDVILILALVAVLLINIVVVKNLRDPALKGVPKTAVTVTGSGAGKVGDVVVEVTCDADKIYLVRVQEHNETEGIGTLAVDQIPGAIVAANSVAVDDVSSATVTSGAIKAAVCEALTSAGFDPAHFGYVEPTPAPTPEPTPEPAPKPAAAPSGEAKTASGKGTGIDGDVIVEVTADANTIYEVVVTQQNETPGLGAVACENLPGEIVAANSLEIDGMSGATVTSNAIKAAVTEALTSMGFDPASYQGAVAAPAEEAVAEGAAPVEEAAAVEIPADAVTLTGKGQGIDGDVVVEVVADADTIYSVTVIQQNETPGIGSVAVEKLPAAIVEANSVEVDGVTGATVTSTAIKNAVTEALAGLSAAPAEEPAPAEETPAEEAAPVEEPAPAKEAPAEANVLSVEEIFTGSALMLIEVDGRNGPMLVQVEFVDGVITDVQVLEHSETVGVGAVAVDWLPGRIVEANSVDVDGISGATITSDAIKGAVVEALESAKNGFSEGPVAIQAEMDGKNGPILLEVTVDGDTITDVQVLEHSETVGVGAVAAEWLPGRIVEANSADVDGISGATVTSDAIKAAVEAAVDFAKNGVSEATFRVIVEGKNGPITLEITVDGDTIVDVQVLEHSETVGVGAVAAEWLPGRIVEANSADVDGISGATVTSDAIKAAVLAALAA